MQAFRSLEIWVDIENPKLCDTKEEAVNQLTMELLHSDYCNEIVNYKDVNGDFIEVFKVRIEKITLNKRSPSESIGLYEKVIGLFKVNK